MNHDEFYDSKEWNVPGEEHFEAIRVECVFKDPDNVKFCWYPTATGVCYCIAKNCPIAKGEQENAKESI